MLWNEKIWNLVQQKILCLKKLSYIATCCARNWVAKGLSTESFSATVYLVVPVQVSCKLVSYKKVSSALNILTKLSNNRIDLLQCIIVPASHAFKTEVVMNVGSNRILSARLGENIIVTSSPGKRSVHGLQGLDLSNSQHISHNHVLNNCHDSMANHKEKYPNINIVDQL